MEDYKDEEIDAILALAMMLMLVPGIAEETQSESAMDAQKLDATYTLALNNAVYYFRAVCNAALGKTGRSYQRSDHLTENQTEDQENFLKYTK